MKHSPADLSRLLNQSPETIRLWSIEFAKYLSPSAAPAGRGKHRSYSDEDAEILALVADYKNRGITFDEIHLSLSNGERGGLPTPKAELAINHTEQITALQTTVINLQTALDKREGHIERLESQLAAALDKIERLTAEKAVLQYRIEAGKTSE